MSVKNCTTRGVALHSSVYTLPFFGAGQPLDGTTVADQLVVLHRLHERHVLVFFAC